MEQVGYQLLDETGAIVGQWGGVWGQCPAAPSMIITPKGDHIHCPELDVIYDGVKLVVWSMEEPPPQVPVQISRRQCAIELRERSQITALEALNMTRTGDMPAMVQKIIDASGFTDEQRIVAATDFAADVYMRNNSLLNQIMSAAGASDADIDNFFIAAAKR